MYTVVVPSEVLYPRSDNGYGHDHDQTWIQIQNEKDGRIFFLDTFQIEF
jgi:hypothetical protein